MAGGSRRLRIESCHPWCRPRCFPRPFTTLRRRRALVRGLTAESYLCYIHTLPCHLPFPPVLPPALASDSVTLCVAGLRLLCGRFLFPPYFLFLFRFFFVVWAFSFFSLSCGYFLGVFCCVLFSGRHSLVWVYFSCVFFFSWRNRSGGYKPLMYPP